MLIFTRGDIIMMSNSRRMLAGGISMTSKQFPFSDLPVCDLIVDAVYMRGVGGGTHNEPLSRLLGCANLAGFRPKRRRDRQGYAFVVLYSTRDEEEWPDHLDRAAGAYVYFGDNRKPGRTLEDPMGNRFLSQVFAAVHSVPPERRSVPPIFVFEKIEGHHVRFLGLAVPGATGVAPHEQLMAIWKTKRDCRFQNYKAVFTILNAEVVSRAWIDDLIDGQPMSSNCPLAWKAWVELGTYQALTTQLTRQHRLREEQLPTKPAEVEVLEAIYAHFANRPSDFELCAIEIAKMADENITSIVRTRPFRCCRSHWLNLRRSHSVSQIGQGKTGSGVLPVSCIQQQPFP